MKRRLNDRILELVLGGKPTNTCIIISNTLENVIYNC